MNGTRFQQRGPVNFPGGAQGAESECARVGHTEPDARGKCYRCAEKVPALTLTDADKRAIEYSRLRSAGVPVEEAAKTVFGPICPLAEDAIAPLTLSQEPV